MPYFVYIIYSANIDQYYIGSCEDIAARLFRHNNSGSKSTKKTNDWVLRHTETFETRSEAVVREMSIKKRKSRKYIDWLITNAAVD